MTSTTRPGQFIQRWYCSDCNCEHEASVLGGAVMPVVPPERGTQLQSLWEVESTRVEEEDYER